MKRKEGNKTERENKKMRKIESQVDKEGTLRKK